MKNRTIHVLLISIVLMGVFIWVQESWRARNSVREAREIKLFDIDADSLEFIEFRITNVVVRCVKENGIWMAGDGKEKTGRADLALVHHMISGLNSMGKGTTITQRHLDMRGLDAGQYGFEPPSVEIVAVDNNGKHRWQVGRKTALGSMVYAKLADSEEIYTIPDKLLFIIPMSHDLLRDRLLIPGEPSGARRVEIRGSAGFVQLLKDPESGWRIQQPVAVKADEKEVALYLGKLYRLRIEEFIADNVSDFSVYGLQGESRQISVGNADGSSRMLIIGDDVSEKPGYVYARRADDTTAFTLNADILQLLDVEGDRFRNADVVSLPAEDVTRIQVARGDEKLELSRQEPGAWAIESPVVWDAESKSVEDLLIFWDNAVITEFSVETNAAPAEWVFEFSTAKEGEHVRVEVLPGQGRKDGLMVRIGADPTLYQINLPYIPEKIIDPLSYKDSNIWKLESKGINKISVLRNGLPPQVVERLDNDTFVPVATNGTIQVKEQAVQNLIDQLETVRTSGYIIYNPLDLQMFGLSDPLLQVHIGLSNSNELGRVLLIGRETPDGYYSMVKGRDVVFYLDKMQVDALTADLLDSGESIAEDLPE